MVRRDPVETGGTYYRILPEGRYENYDGHTLRIAKPKESLDLNRNFPASWRQEFEQVGAGPYPLSEPETRAVADFIVGHPNIGAGTTFHTWSGVLLRPFEHQSDDEMHAEDLWAYKRVGEEGHARTGYPAISVYHEFRYHPKEVIGGTFDWLYEHMGAFTWVVEIWSPDARGRHRRLQVHRLVPRPPGRGRPEAHPLERHDARRPRPQALARVRPSATRARGDRRLEPLPRVLESAAGVPRARGRALPVLARVAGADLAEARARARGREARRPGHLEGHAGRAEHRLAAGLRHQARARAQDRARPLRRDRAARRRDAAVGQAARRAWASSRAARTRRPASRSGPTTTSPTTARRSSGSCAARRATKWRSSRGTNARGSCARRSSSPDRRFARSRRPHAARKTPTGSPRSASSCSPACSSAVSASPAQGHQRDQADEHAHEDQRPLAHRRDGNIRRRRRVGDRHLLVRIVARTRDRRRCPRRRCRSRSSGRSPAAVGV